jgi:hypothetical protein
MEVITRNSEGVGINGSLETFLDIKADPGKVFFALFLKQLHLPGINWAYHPTDRDMIRLEEPEEVIQLDEIKNMAIEANELVYPAQAYSYFLLTQYLQIEKPLSSLFLVPGRKSQFLFDLIDFQPKTEAFQPKRNGVISLVKGIRNKKIIREAHESFFVLLDQKFGERLNTACLAWQSKTGQTINKSRWLAYCVDKDRLKKLEKFSTDLIQEL